MGAGRGTGPWPLFSSVRRRPRAGFRRRSYGRPVLPLLRVHPLPLFLLLLVALLTTTTITSINPDLNPTDFPVLSLPTLPLPRYRRSTAFSSAQQPSLATPRHHLRLPIPRPALASTGPCAATRCLCRRSRHHRRHIRRRRIALPRPVNSSVGCRHPIQGHVSTPHTLFLSLSPSLSPSLSFCFSSFSLLLSRRLLCIRGGSVIPRFF